MTRRGRRLLATLVVALLAWGWGLALWQLNFGQAIRNAAYDLPFLFQVGEPPEMVVLIGLDEFSHDKLDQPLAGRWDRRLHARLVDHLAAEGARTIVFDILFYDAVPEEDALLAAAMQRHGQVLLAGELEQSESTAAEQERLLLATPDLRQAATGWGLTYVQPEADGLVRQVTHEFNTAFGPKPSLSAKTALTHREGLEASIEPALLNYYGPSIAFTNYSYADVLQGRGIPAGAFRDKLVIIGARQQAGLAHAGKDTFPTPYSAFSRELSPGMEVHATAAANLLAGQSLRQTGPRTSFLLLSLAAFALAAAACLLSPGRGLLLTLVLAAGAATLGFLLHRSGFLVIPWTIPVLGQAPLVVALGLGAHYLIEYAARWKLRRAFKSYMSDEQARQIDEDEVSLELGGKEVEATILFSDLAGFTSMSEGLPPQSVSKALISYFESATAGILDNKGTIIKYIGDAVMATWGAPLQVEREADRSLDAAIQMQLAGRSPVSLETESGTSEQVLETRIGINSGPGLAGNLGSKRRFDYSVIGDTTNTAARLESLNKALGTSILISDAVLRKCADPEHYVLRRMGRYVLKGKKQGILVHEVLGHRGGDLVRERSGDYLENYRRGLLAFEAGRWDEARDILTRALHQHDRLEEDPASRLLLETMASVGSDPPLTANWTGEIILGSK